MMPQLDVYAYVHPDMVPVNQAYLHVTDLAIQRGYGVFDYFKIKKGIPLFLKDYLNRFYASGLLMGLKVPMSEDAFRATLENLIKKNALPNSAVRMILTGGYSRNGNDPAQPNLIMVQELMDVPGKEQYYKGLKLITQEYVREMPCAKTINYCMGIRLQQMAKAQGADDVLYFYKGEVTECPSCNVFMVTQDNAVLTPSKNVLMGITRKNVLSLASRKHRVQEACFSVQDLHKAKEVFVTSTIKQILPVVEVDGKPIGDGKPGDVTLGLSNDLARLEQEYIEGL